MKIRPIIHPKELLAKEEQGITQFNTKLALKITNGVGTMWTAYVFTILALISLPAILVQGNFVAASTFPKWLIAASLIALVAWVAQTFIQLVLLPIIMVGQNVIQAQNDAKADADHKNLVYLVEIQNEQLEILKELKEKGNAS